MCQELHLDLHGQRLLAAVSGGGDSLALLCCLYLLRPWLGCTLHVLHVDHGLRPESPNEALVVAGYCASWGIPCTLRQAAVAEHAACHGLGLEEAGRQLRYAVLEEERQRLPAAWILTGHQQEDLEEDVLLRLIRGTGWPALGGMQALDADRHLLRPLLCCAPQELRALLHACQVPWLEDSSNADSRFRRNRLRHSVLPLLRAENPSLHRSIAQLHTLAQLDAAHWTTVLDAALRACPWQETAAGITLPALLLRRLDQAGRLRLYLRTMNWLHHRHGHTGQARASSLFALDAAWQAGRGGTCFQFPGTLEARLHHGAIHFGPASPKKH